MIELGMVNVMVENCNKIAGTLKYIVENKLSRKTVTQIVTTNTGLVIFRV